MTRTPIKLQASLLVLDFKDRRNQRQLASFQSIWSRHQHRLDTALEAEWRRRVADNEARRYAAKLAGVPPVSARVALAG